MAKQFCYKELTPAQQMGHLFRESRQILSIGGRYETRHDPAFHRALEVLVQLRKMGPPGSDEWALFGAGSSHRPFANTR